MRQTQQPKGTELATTMTKNRRAAMSTSVSATTINTTKYHCMDALVLQDPGLCMYLALHVLLKIFIDRKISHPERDQHSRDGNPPVTAVNRPSCDRLVIVRQPFLAI